MVQLIMSSSVSTGKVEKRKEEEEFPHAAAADDIERGSSPAYGSDSNTTAEPEPEPEKKVKFERNQRLKQVLARLVGLRQRVLLKAMKKNVQFEREQRLMQAQNRVESRPRILHRVPPQMRRHNKRVYDPEILFLSPYNHHQCLSRSMKEFKDEVVGIICSADEQSVLRGKILDRVDEIRRFYEGISRDEYDDETLTDMILRNACVVVYLMNKNRAMMVHARRSIGFFKFALVFDDYLKLENQIPWWVIKYLINLIHNDDDDDDDDDDDGDGDDGIRLKDGGRTFIKGYLTAFIHDGYNKLNRFRLKNKEYLHLLDVLRTFLLKDGTDRPFSVFEEIKIPLHSATELHAKGIHFRPSSRFLNDIMFDSCLLQGVLYLPVLPVDRSTMTLFSNMIALELSPGANTDCDVASYVNFMKSVIQNPGDVKILQEKGILLDYLGDNEQIVRLFKEINIHGLDSLIFRDIKQRINEYCHSKCILQKTKTKTWMADLNHTYFRTPWTALALLAAAFLLCLTFLQTYYTINPRKSGN